MVKHKEYIYWYNLILFINRKFKIQNILLYII